MLENSCSVKSVLTMAFLVTFIAEGISQNQQILPQNAQGESLFSPYLDRDKSATLLNLNTGTQSLGIDYYFSSKSASPEKYSVFRIGASGKATEGVGTLLSKGQFSPGAKIYGSVSIIPLLAPKLIKAASSKFDDWLTINASYSVDKYKLYNKDTIFRSQVSDSTFGGFSLGLNYIMVLGYQELDYFSIRASYDRKNNFSDLSSIEVMDNRNTFDSTSGVIRTASKSVVAREGNYKEYDGFTWGLSYTRLPKYPHKYIQKSDKSGNETETKVEKVTEKVTVNGITFNIEREAIKEIPKPNPFYKSLRLGYSVYLNTLTSNISKPVSNLGAIIFVLSPNKDDIMAPRLGVDLYFKDITDSKKTNTGLLKRFNVAFTTTIAL